MALVPVQKSPSAHSPQRGDSLRTEAAQRPALVTQSWPVTSTGGLWESCGAPLQDGCWCQELPPGGHRGTRLAVVTPRSPSALSDASKLGIMVPKYVLTWVLLLKRLGFKYHSITHTGPATSAITQRPVPGPGVCPRLTEEEPHACGPLCPGTSRSEPCHTPGPPQQALTGAEEGLQGTLRTGGRPCGAVLTRSAGRATLPEDGPWVHRLVPRHLS